MRRPDRVVPELTLDQPSSVRPQAKLKFIDFRNNLVNMEGGFITETPILCDSVEAGESLDASNHIAVHIFNVRDG